MRRIMGVVAASVLMLGVLGGCGTDASLSDSLVGMWKTSVNGVYVDFHDDGTYLVSVSREGTGKVEWGTWSVEGSTLTETPASDSRYCAGIVATYEVKVVDDGNRLENTVVDDACTVRLEDTEPGLTRVDDVGS